jgi:hypothetical protein
MTKVKAGQILNLRPEAVVSCIKNKKLKIDLKGELIDESVFEYKKELDERRKVQPASWIKRNEF